MEKYCQKESIQISFCVGFCLIQTTDWESHLFTASFLPLRNLAFFSALFTCWCSWHVLQIKHTHTAVNLLPFVIVSSLFLSMIYFIRFPVPSKDTVSWQTPDSLLSLDHDVFRHQNDVSLMYQFISDVTLWLLLRIFKHHFSTKPKWLH